MQKFLILNSQFLIKKIWEAKMLCFKSKTGFSLLEILISIAIISILSLIALATYSGALDNADIKGAIGPMRQTMRNYAKMAKEEGKPVTLQFEIGTPIMRVYLGSGDEANLLGEVNFKNNGLLKRKLVFRKYKWPDGSSEPATFTFFPDSKPQAGVLYFGSAFADTKIYLQGDRISSDAEV